MLLREGFKRKRKKLVESSTKRGGGGALSARFSTQKKKRKKIWAQNSGFCLRIILRHTYFFSIFGWGDPSQLGSWSEGHIKGVQ